MMSSSGGRVDDAKIGTVLDHLRYLVEVHVEAVSDVVEASVFVLLDENGLLLHTGLHSIRLTSFRKGVALNHAAVQHVLQHKTKSP